ncbi:unnamed protein product [Calypogeia fissa]
MVGCIGCMALRPRTGFHRPEFQRLRDGAEATDDISRRRRRLGFTTPVHPTQPTKLATSFSSAVCEERSTAVAAEAPSRGHLRRRIARHASWYPGNSRALPNKILPECWRVNVTWFTVTFLHVVATEKPKVPVDRHRPEPDRTKSSSSGLRECGLLFRFFFPRAPADAPTWTGPVFQPNPVTQPSKAAKVPNPSNVTRRAAVRDTGAPAVGQVGKLGWQPEGRTEGRAGGRRKGPRGSVRPSVRSRPVPSRPSPSCPAHPGMLNYKTKAQSRVERSVPCTKTKQTSKQSIAKARLRKQTVCCSIGCVWVGPIHRPQEQKNSNDNKGLEEGLAGRKGSSVIGRQDSTTVVVVERTIKALVVSC